MVADLLTQTWAPMRLHGFIARSLAALRRPGSQPEGDWAFHHAAGIMAYARGDYRGAERRFLAALEQAESSVASERAASSLNNLGLVYRSRRQLRKAEAHFRRALQVYEASIPGGAQVARVLYHLATLCHAKKEYTEAESLYQRCIVLTQRALGESHPKLAKRLEAYAHLLKHTKREDRAAQMLARATTIRAQHEGAKI
jgi:tetratricopeptide (TPR) repeat protein